MNNLDYTIMMGDVQQFRMTMGLPIATGALSTSEIALHEGLTVEELTELATATDRVQIADAIVDTVYVLIGRLVHAGETYECARVKMMIEHLGKVAERLHIPFLECWREIHKSNMSKVCHGWDEVTASTDYYKAIGITCSVESFGDPNIFVLKCKSDDSGTIPPGKVLKSINYKKPDLRNLL
jgi:hypothetical protein